MEGRKAAFAKIGRDDRMLGMEETGFKDEREIEDLVSSNLSEIFPCLKKLANQFSVEVPGEVGMDKSRGFIIDTLAFDSEKKCFVVIEYKNKIDNGLIGQVLGYKELIAKNKADFMYVHENSGMTVKDYDWSLPYVIIISPAHTYKQSAAIEHLLRMDDNLIKMYEIQKFDDFIVTLDRIKGTPVCGSRHSGQRPDKVVIRPGSDHSPALAANTLLKKFDSLIDDVIHVERRKLKRYIAYKLPTGRNICTVIASKNRLKIYYAADTRDNILHEDDFVKLYQLGKKYYGGGDYMSIITSTEDARRAVGLVKKIHDFVTGSTGSVHDRYPSTSGHIRQSGYRPSRNAGNTGHQLLTKLESVILDMGRLERKKLTRYIVYRLSAGKNVCTIIPQKNRLKLYYAPRDHNHVLHEDDFVRYDRIGRLHGAGDYMSIISDFEDIDKAIGPLKRVYEWRTGRL